MSRYSYLLSQAEIINWKINAFAEMTAPPYGEIWQITLVKINMGKLLNPKLYFIF